MGYRLPRLPRDAALIGADGRPTLAMQRWWQSVVEALEDAQGGVNDLEVNTPPAIPNEASEPLTPPAVVFHGDDPLIPPAHPVQCDDLLYPPFYGS